nr:IS3 family transposase [Limosilactobacillus reuteri]
MRGLFAYYQAKYGVRRLSTQIRDYYHLIDKKAPNHKRIQRLMHKMRIKYNRQTRKYDSSKVPNGKKAKNKLNRRFMSNRKYKKWSVILLN